MKKQKVRFLSTLLSTFGDSLLEILITSKDGGVTRRNNQSGKMSLYPLTNFEIQTNYYNEPKFHLMFIQ